MILDTASEWIGQGSHLTQHTWGGTTLTNGIWQQILNQG